MEPGIFIDATGGCARNFDNQFQESHSKSDLCMDTFIWVPAPGGGAPFVVLELLSRDQTAAHLTHAIAELDHMQREMRLPVLKPVRVNVDCGWNLLAAAAQSWNHESSAEYLAFGWSELWTKGSVDWGARTIISWCRTHIVNAIERWVKQNVKYGRHHDE